MDHKIPEIEPIKPQPKKPLPLFELLISLFSLYMASILIWFSRPLERGAEQGTSHNGLENVLAIADFHVWAAVFFTAAVVKIVGMLMNKRLIRIIGLAMSTGIYTVLGICYTFTFPNFAVGIFGLLAFVSLIQIFYTEYFEFT